MTQEADYIAATGGQLGRPNSTRRRTYEALKRHLDYLRAHERSSCGMSSNGRLMTFIAIRC